MQKQIWLCSLIIFASLLQSKTEVLACGDYGTTSEEFEAQLTKHLTDRMLSLTAIRNPMHDQWQEITRITEQLRTLGQPGLNAIIKSREVHADQGSETFQLDRLDKQLTSLPVRRMRWHVSCSGTNLLQMQKLRQSHSAARFSASGCLDIWMRT